MRIAFPVSGSWVVEETAPEGESSPHTNALITSAFITGTPSWPDTLGVSAKTASANTQVCFIILLVSSFRARRREKIPPQHLPDRSEIAADTARRQLSKVTGYSVLIRSEENIWV